MAIQPRPAACINNPVTTSGRSPNFCTTAPAIGAVRNSVDVHGSNRSPAPSGPKPSVTCKNCGSRNNTPYIAA